MPGFSLFFSLKTLASLFHALILLLLETLQIFLCIANPWKAEVSGEERRIAWFASWTACPSNSHIESLIYLPERGVGISSLEAAFVASDLDPLVRLSHSERISNWTR